MKRIWSVLLGLVAVLTFAGCASSGTPAAEPATTRTVTVTVRSAPKPVVKHDVAVAAACRAALSEADEIRGMASDFGETLAKFPPLIAQAYQAGATFSSSAPIVRKMKAANGEIQDLNDRLTPMVQSFNADRDKCLAE